ncbi:IS66 family insertion sequence element accessory protein TnpA [Janthinobacterium agaricidamnosum]|uniref:IS66 family insertion sequence element accessory protein TnpA n=1 Tax=Janthinobacterium agaricidamnosum TaxID=55508 RepID=UPI003BB576BC
MQWRASGLSQRAFAIRHGIPIRQVGYWVRRLAGVRTKPALLPVRVVPAPVVAPAACLVPTEESAESCRVPEFGFSRQRKAPSP